MEYNHQLLSNDRLFLDSVGLPQQEDLDNDYDDVDGVDILDSDNEANASAPIKKVEKAKWTLNEVYIFV